MTHRSLLSASLLLASLVGCGAAGPMRYNVSGQVTYEGEPLPSGEVVLEPDASRGNKGPQAHAPIIQGRYATAPGQGAVPGPAIVRVLAYDGKSHPESPYGVPLRSPHEFRLELPAQDSSQDLAVPHQAR